jgi:phage replication-related protein YjqB (UPF0714/DUF867 family)
MRPQDRYENYAELCESKREGIDFQIHVIERTESTAVIATHGGQIEPGTFQIAAAIADDSYSLYCFQGLRSRPHSDLHITSTSFDEPRCLRLIAKCDLVVSVHGLRGKHEAVQVGGLDISVLKNSKRSGSRLKLLPGVLPLLSPRLTYATAEDGRSVSN